MTDSDARRQADLRGEPYLAFSDTTGRERIVSLSDAWDKATIGRDAGTDICLNWDPEVSRVHAQLERLGDAWTLVDAGLSRNGSFVNGERVSGSRRLADGDELRFGGTNVTFKAPFQVGDETIPPRNAESD